VVTLFPEMFEAVTRFGVSARAAEAGLYELHCFNPRDYAGDRHRTVDDHAYGGGPGMVMRFAPLTKAIRAASAELGPTAAVAYLSPQGRRLDQRYVSEIGRRAALVLVAGRYEGIDERVVDAAITEEISIGDYVLSGGEIAAMVLIDAVVRTLPGALGDEASALHDSFVDGLLDYPHYTRPEEIEGRRVPQVLLSGDHRAIAKWRRRQALGRTWIRRPDLIAQSRLSEEDQALLEEFLGDRD
jgi:tRNA (guanine37-N1)-methyltransferase